MIVQRITSHHFGAPRSQRCFCSGDEAADRHQKAEEEDHQGQEVMAFGLPLALCTGDNVEQVRRRSNNSSLACPTVTHFETLCLISTERCAMMN